MPHKKFQHSPQQDYVHQVKHTTSAKGHVDVACRVLAFPCLISLVFAASVSPGNLAQHMLTGFAIGYSAQSLVVYSFYAIRSLIRGESHGV